MLFKPRLVFWRERSFFGGYLWFHVPAALNAPTFPWLPAFLGQKESAYPSAQNPEYDAAIREWALDILNHSNAAIQPLLDRQVARTLVENRTAGIPGVTLFSLYERIIQINAGLEAYQVTLTL